MEVSLIGGGGGIFEIKADGEFVTSKAKLFRYPEPPEVIELLKNRLV